MELYLFYAAIFFLFAMLSLVVFFRLLGISIPIFIQKCKIINEKIWSKKSKIKNMKEFDEMKKSVKKYVDDYFTNYFIELIVNYEPNFQHSNITFEEYLETELKKFEEENKEKLINKEEEIFLGVPKVDEKEDYLDDTSVSKQSSDICDKV